MTPPPFTEWVSSTGLKLTPGQLAMWRVLGDGLDPVDDDMGRTIFGGTFTAPANARKCAVLRKGARIGGTMISAYLLLYRGMTVELRGLAPGERASGPIVGPDMRLARQALSYVVGLAEELRLEVVSKGSDSMTL